MKNLRAKNIRKIPSGNQTLNSQYSMVTSLILVALVQLALYLFPKVKSIQFPAEPGSNDLIQIFFYQSCQNLGLAFVLACIGPILIFLTIYAINLVDKKPFNDSLVNHWFLIIFETILISISLYATALVATLVNYYFGLIWSIGVILFMFTGVFFTQKFLKMKFIIIYNKVYIFELIALVLFCLISLFSFKQMTEPTLELKKEVFTSKDHTGLVELNGRYSVYDAKIHNIITQEDIPIKTYESETKTVLVIDFDSLDITEGEYTLNFRTDSKSYVKHFVYIFNGTEEDRAKYIERFINKIRGIKQNSDISNNEFEQTLLKLKKGYLIHDENQVTTVSKIINEMTSNKSGAILNELMSDPVVGFIRIEISG